VLGMTLVGGWKHSKRPPGRQRSCEGNSQRGATSPAVCTCHRLCSRATNLLPQRAEAIARVASPTAQVALVAVPFGGVSSALVTLAGARVAAASLAVVGLAVVVIIHSNLAAAQRLVAASPRLVAAAVTVAFVRRTLHSPFALRFERARRADYFLCVAMTVLLL
jgi:hypothetical protein